AQNKTIQRLTGLPPSAHYGASKLHDLATETGQDGQKNNAGNACLTPLISFLLHHLLENKPCIVDHANAQRTQLLDLTRLQWSETLTKLFAVPVQALPACVPVLSSSPGGHGLLAGTTMPVRAISGDQNAALYGTGDLQPDCALVNIGSGAFVMRLLPQYTASEKLLTSIACSSQQQVQYLREGTINGAGSALDWLAKKHPDNAIPTHLPAWLQTIEHPPVFINAVGGLGSPWWRSDITPCFIRAGDHRPVEEATVAGQAVAVVESIVFLVMENLAMMQREHAIQRLRISGGLSQLDGLCQRLADLSGLPVERVEQAEATARGIAWLASGSSKAWPASFKLFSPADNSGLNKRYQVLITELKKRTA
ncbi:MAG TPA: hypothetical protein ENJ64_02160, partial [Thiotrichales bacterium]|nr:hypothetical protein [Thiotrichales bacterium]